MILFNTLDYDPTKEVVKFMDGKLRSKEAFVASGFGVSFVDGEFKRLNIYQSTFLRAKTTFFDKENHVLEKTSKRYYSEVLLIVS